MKQIHKDLEKCGKREEDIRIIGEFRTAVWKVEMKEEQMRTTWMF